MLLAVLKHGSNDLKAGLLFRMLAENGVVRGKVLAQLGRALQFSVAQLKQLRSQTSREELTEAEIREMVNRNEESLLVAWMHDAVKPYKGLDEVSENAKAVGTQDTLANSKLRLTFPLDTRELFAKYQLTDNEIEGFSRSHIHLLNDSLLKVEHIAGLLANWGLSSSLAALIAKDMDTHEGITLHRFVTVLGLFVKSNLTVERNEFLYRLLAGGDFPSTRL